MANLPIRRNTRNVKFNFFSKILFLAFAVLCFVPIVPSWVALIGGIIFALTLGNPFLKQTQIYSKKFLALSIVGLGAGMNLSVIVDAGLIGLFYTALSIVFAIGLGILLGRMLKVESNIAALITFGSAICGGSAIAAAAPVLKAKEHEITAALGVVFSLNALALIIFPIIGQWTGLSQEQFGLWAALAIHDTSSVVGASMQYGAEALEVGTTVKLVRALWIIPLVLALAFVMSRKDQKQGGENTKVKLPWFIVGFVALSAIVTIFPEVQSIGDKVADGAKRLLVLTLFLIGAGMSVDAIKRVGVKPLIHGVVLWGFIASMSLLVILNMH